MIKSDKSEKRFDKVRVKSGEILFSKKIFFRKDIFLTKENFVYRRRFFFFFRKEAVFCNFLPATALHFCNIFVGGDFNCS